MAGQPPTGQGNTYPTIESGFRLVLITAGILAATLMQTLDTTIVNVALPIIQGNLGATLDEGSWVVTGYIISAVIVIPLTPWLQIRFGRRQYYSAAIIGFTIASVLCGLSHSITELILWRIVQGAFGGGLIATAQATLRDTFPKDKFGLSQGLFSIGAIVGPAVGPTMGGWLTDNVSWNWVFFINVVPGIFAGIVMLTSLKNPNDPRRLPLDVIGLGLLIVGLGSLQYVLGEGQRNDWFSDSVILSFGITSALGLLAFVGWELFGTKNPVVDLRVLRYPQVAAGATLAFAVGATLYGGIVIFPQFVQSVLGFTATLSGELIFVRAAFIAVGAPLAVRLATGGKVDTRYMLLAGFTMVGISQFWFAQITTSGNDFESLVAPNILSGLGLSLLFIPISIAMLNGLNPQTIPKAAAFQSLSQQLGGSISTAALVTLLSRRDAFHQDNLAQFIQPAYAPVARFLGEHGSLGQLYGDVVREASVMSFADCQFVLGVLAIALLPLVFIMPGRRKTAGPVHMSLE
jgi:MFS transporter, DHA2 family, multidrug resistance protein